MIDGLALDYAGTRAAARLAWRPDERQWQRLRTARNLRALLDNARAAPVGQYLSGVAATAQTDDIDVAFRAQYRARVAELVAWAPTAWRAAVRWTAHLADLDAVAHLWTQPPRPWMLADPVLARYAREPSSGSRRAALVSGPLGPLGRALLAHAAAAERAGTRKRGKDADTPVVLGAWIDHWRRLWPAVGAEQREALQRLCAAALAHRRRFATLPPADTGAAREAFAQRMLAHQRADPAQPVALFAYLLVLALDLERLRAECLMRTFDAAHGMEAA